jgi:hypothetical protein
LKFYKEGRHTNFNNSYDGTESTNLINEENRRLKAENNVLQKKLSGRKKNEFRKNKISFLQNSQPKL